MGRLPAVMLRIACSSAAALLLLVGCGDAGTEKTTPPPPDGRRSEVIAGNGTATPQKPAPIASAPSAARPATAICDSPPPASGKPIPKGELAKVVAAGSKGLPDAIDIESVWTWVNLWAGWCGPCKEEMPILAGWEKKLRSEGTPMHLAFVSIDDDERQAMRFLESQPSVKESFRLPEGSPRKTWLEAVGLAEAPQLPVHLLFDPKGALRCMITGAIRETDYAKVKEIVSRN